MPALALLLTTLISSLLARILLGAGLTFVTYSWVEDVLDDLISQGFETLIHNNESAVKIVVNPNL